MTQLEAARGGSDHRGDAARGASARTWPPEFIRDEVARGRLVIPANVRHLAGSGGEAPAATAARDVPGRGARPSGRAPSARSGSNQTVAQRRPGDRRCRAPARRARAEAPRSDRHRAHDHHQDQRQHRRLAGVERHGGGGREAALGAELRRRHADGPLDRRRPRRVPPGDHRPRDDPDRHGADLQHDRRPAHRGPDLRRHPRGDRAPGAAGRRLLHHPRRRAARAPAAGRPARHAASSRAAARCSPSG